MITLNSESAICLTKVLFGVILIIYCLSRRYLVLPLQVIWSLAFSIKLCGDTEKASDFFRWGYLRIFFKNGESESSFNKVCFTKFKTTFASIKSWIDSNGKCAWHPLNFCKISYCEKVIFMFVMLGYCDHVLFLFHLTMLKYILRRWKQIVITNISVNILMFQHINLAKIYKGHKK